MEQEDYKIIEHQDIKFQVFRDGRIFRITKTGIKQVALTPHLTHRNKYYFSVSIKGKETKAHRLLAKAFLNLNIDDKTQVVDHIDGNGLNNSFENLRVVTQRDNNRNLKNISACRKNGNSFQSRIRNNEGIQIQKTCKTVELVMAWRHEKEKEFGYLTRASGVLSKSS